MAQRRVLVTGGAGFIGSTLARALCERGDHVRVLDNFATGRHCNLDGIEDDIDLHEGDIRSLDDVSRATRGVDVVFHQAALPSVPRSVRDPLTTNAVNVGGTLNVLSAARDAGVGRVVFASSSSVYGDNGAPLRVETDTPAPVSPYAVSKLAGEQYCLSFHRIYRLETVCLRYFNVFGPNQDPASEYAAVVPRFIAAALEGRPVQIFGDGRQSRDFTFVDNVVGANIGAAESPHAVGAVVNVATGISTTVDELADEVASALGVRVAKEHLPPRPGDVLESLAQLSRARALLGYEPVVTLEEGLRVTAASLRGVLVGQP